MQATPRLTRKQAAEAYALQLTSAPTEPEPKRDPDALQPGRGILPDEASALLASVTTLVDGLARKGVHRAHIAETIAETCCGIHRTGTATGVQNFVAEVRLHDARPVDAIAAEVRRQIG